MRREDLDAITTELARETRRYIDERIKSVDDELRNVAKKIWLDLDDRLILLRQEVKAVEGPPGPPGRDGKDGKDGAPGQPGEPGQPSSVGPELLEALIRKTIEAHDLRVKEAVGLAVGMIEPRSGAPGRDGADGAPGRDGVDGKDGRDGVDGAPGKDGLDGKDGLNGKDGAKGLDGTDGAPGRDGKDGADGRSVTVEDVRPVILDEIQRAVVAIPRPADGKSITVDDVRPMLVDLVEQTMTKAVAALPQPRDGRDGLPGVQGPPGEKGMDAKDGAPGRDGKDGQDGAAGRDGVDGLGFDDLDLKFEDTSGYRLEVRSGERVKAWPVPIPWDAGVWRYGRTYPAGAGVTTKGHFWIAQTSTLDRPGDSKAWRLAVRRGEDGKPPKSGDE